MIKTIYNLEPTCRVYPEGGGCHVWITYNNHTFHGEAHITPSDKDFFSEKVGLHIAHSRAIISALKFASRQSKLIYDTKYQMYQEAVNYGTRPPAEVDPTGAFLRKVILAEKNYRRLQKAIKREEKNLNFYLQGQDKMVRIIKTKRQMDEKK